VNQPKNVLVDSASVLTLSTAEVASTDPEEYSRNGRSGYADAVAWLAVEAARRALTDVPAVLAASEETAVLALSDHCTLTTMQNIARRMHAGKLSPMHFAGANPGLLAGAVCMRWHMRGPSLTLTMPPRIGSETARLVASGWLHKGQARFVLLITHELHGVEHFATCTVFGRKQ